MASFAVRGVTAFPAVKYEGLIVDLIHDEELAKRPRPGSHHGRRPGRRVDQSSQRGKCGHRPRQRLRTAWAGIGRFSGRQRRLDRPRRGSRSTNVLRRRQRHYHPNKLVSTEIAVHHPGASGWVPEIFLATEGRAIESIKVIGGRTLEDLGPKSSQLPHPVGTHSGEPRGSQGGGCGRRRPAH